MRTLRVGRFGRARVWIGESPAAAFDAAGLVSRTVASGTELPVLTAVGLEAFLPRGPLSEYGLLGLSGMPQKDQRELRLEVLWAQVDGAPWRAALAGGSESPRVGLPQEFADAVLDGLEAASGRRLVGGVLAVRAAVHSPVGTNPNFMARLARACVELMLHGDMADDDLGTLLEAPLLT